MTLGSRPRVSPVNSTAVRIDESDESDRLSPRSVRVRAMAVTSWTSRYEAAVRADLESVLAWWTSQQRSSDQRARFENLDVPDFAYHETEEADTRRAEMSWINSEGLFVSLRIETPNRQDGNVKRAADGAAILRSRTSQQRRWPDRRKDSLSTNNLTEFRKTQLGTTEVRLTTPRHKEGAWWWERFVPPTTERNHQRRHLQQMVAKCEHDLGVI